MSLEELACVRTGGITSVARVDDMHKGSSVRAGSTAPAGQPQAHDARDIRQLTFSLVVERSGHAGACSGLWMVVTPLFARHEAAAPT